MQFKKGDIVKDIEEYAYSNTYGKKGIILEDECEGNSCRPGCETVSYTVKFQCDIVSKNGKYLELIRRKDSEI